MLAKKKEGLLTTSFFPYPPYLESPIRQSQAPHPLRLVATEAKGINSGGANEAGNCFFEFGVGVGVVVIDGCRDPSLDDREQAGRLLLRRGPCSPAPGTRQEKPRADLLQHDGVDERVRRR